MKRVNEYTKRSSYVDDGGVEQQLMLLDATLVSA